MTAPLSHQTVSVKDPAAIRKRRRRAPTGGAADDCFTCSKRNIKCDRRRPYCSQCLEIGNECSGYKTQLTWGVGVASRGKLRGLSLPIAQAPRVSREPKKSPVARSRANSGTAAAAAAATVQLQQTAWRDHDESAAAVRRPIDIPPASHAPTQTTPAYSIPGYDYLPMSHHSITPPMPQGSWGSAYSPGLVTSPDLTPKYARFPLHLSTDILSSSVDSVGSEVDYLSPLSQSYPREEMPFSHSPTVLYETYPPQQSSPVAQSPPLFMLDHCRAPASYHPGLVYAPTEPTSTLNSHLDSFELHLGHKLMRECDGFNVPEVDSYGTSCSSAGPVWSPPHNREEHVKSPLSDNNNNNNPSQWPVLQRPLPIRTHEDLLSKMPFFMDYFKITMAPSMVFIDGSRNPFREHILALAVESQSLQHAICALSACNLRMKRRLSLGHNTRELLEKLMAEKQAAEAMDDTQIEDQSLSEEFQHRNMAVHLLNQQLNDPVQSCHDSVLATILLLCHYRMVESGVAKFHTQFAGVRKILSMRRSQGLGSSGDSKWMETLFTYFDAISASINDREAHLAPGFEDVSPDVQNLPLGVENMVGCDSQLFKTIGKLGRLNILSQNRPVQGMGGGSGQPQQGSIRFDGNGFGTMLGDEKMPSSAACSPTSFEDCRHLFWSEWKKIRQDLQNWRFDASAVATSLPGSPTTGQVRDLDSVSEAFRYAALLYSERLASPSLPPTHVNFQNLVSQVVYYATSLEPGSAASKFLLWPLFVAGSECINEMQQNMIRNKCRDMMSRSGYMNSLAALDVLEKLWSGDLKSGHDAVGGGRGPFNWTKCLGGPGAGVEWIMF